ncbi:MAG: type III secretion system translocon subunit SctE [Chlamydiales bacterium]|nr:type III secretion system translocon subunit SctE [Chlamydiales bacterium]
MEIGSFLPRSDVLTDCFTPVEKQEITEITQDAEVALNPLHDLPILPKPKEFNLDYMFLRLQEAQGDLTRAELQNQTTRIEEEAKKVRDLRELRTKKVQEAAEKVSSTKSWGLLVRAATVFTSLVSIGIGITAVATGAGLFAGVAMIVAGSAMLANEVASELKLWDKLADILAGNDKKQKERILYHLELWIALGTALISVLSLSAGSTAVLKNGVKVAQMALQGGSQVISGVASFGRTMNEQNRLYLEHEVKKLDGRVKFVSKSRETLTEHLTSSFKRQEELGKCKSQWFDSNKEQAKHIASIISGTRG